MSKKEINVFIEAYNYAVDFLENIDEYFPDNEFTLNVLYITSIILELISNNDITILDQEETVDELYSIIDERIIKNRNNIKDRYKDIIENLSDDLLEKMLEYTDEDQIAIIIDALINLIRKDPIVFDNSSYEVVVAKIEPYIDEIINAKGNTQNEE